MKKICFAILIILFAADIAHPQQSLSELKPAEYFNFWVGEWQLSWKASDGTTEYGTNKIEQILNDKVIKENFEATSGQMKGFIGKSYSVYNPKTNSWYQTWVDNRGAYLDFVGKFEDDKRMFVRETKDSTGSTIIQRMVFYDIEPTSFTWDWERSSDGGETWELLWKIAYRRH